jgi:Domain of unknown function (DUF6268)
MIPHLEFPQMKQSHHLFKTRFFILSFFFSTLFRLGTLSAQPYLDLLNVKYVNSPSAGFHGDDKNKTVLNYFNISTNLPLQFSNKKDVIVFSPYFERWSSEVQSINGYGQFHYGLALPVTWVKTLADSNWSLSTTAIVRINDIAINASGQFQYGGALSASYRKIKHLTLKFGIYLNGEFFGLFVVPLLGIDWQINETTNLFGILPASMTLEHKISRRISIGATFRTLTNSYHDSATNYIRIDENQLGLYLDTYLSKNIVLNLGAGHSLFRKIRSGQRYDIKDNWNAEDNLYFKCTIAYRIRFR